MLWFPYRPHILEILLEAAVASTFQPYSGPSIDIFKSFKSKWNSIDKNKFDLLEYFPHQEKEKIIAYASKQLIEKKLVMIIKNF